MTRFTDDVLTNPLTIFAAAGLGVVGLLHIAYGPNMLLGMLLWIAVAGAIVLVGIAVVVAAFGKNRQ